MNRIARFVVEHTGKSWAVAVLLAVLAALIAIGVAVTSSRQERLTRLAVEAERHNLVIMSQTLNGNQMGAIGLLGLINGDIKLEARNLLPPNSGSMALLMEQIARLHTADGAFVVGGDGIIKSSWGIGKPLTGVDVKFRPYTQMALKGTQNVYAAIGTTTGRRNLYFAAPMYAGNRTDTPVIGAVVMRSGVTSLDQQIASAGDHALLLSPQGIVFAASNESWIGRAAKTPTPDQLAEIRKLKQFGTMFDSKVPEPLPFSIEPGLQQMNDSRVAVVAMAVRWNDPSGDWKLVVMENLDRTVPLSAFIGLACGVALAMLLIELLIITLLRSHHAKSVAGQELTAYAKAQESTAAVKSRPLGGMPSA